MTASQPPGPIIQSFFLDHLVAVKGLRPASVRSYRDTIRLFLCFVARDKGTKITKLKLEDLTFERALGFLRHLEEDRGNHVRTRNQRLAALHTLFDYIASREPEMLGVCQQVAAIPMKRSAPAETHFLERDEVARREAQIASLNQQISSLNQQSTDLEAKKAGLERDIAALGDRLGDAEKRAAEAAAQKDAEINRLKGTYDSLVKDLQSEISKGEIKVTQIRDKLSVQMVEKILFDSGKAEIKSQGKEVLSKVGQVLQGVRDKQIRIEGHTDAVPISVALRQQFPTNWELSAVRATTVLRELIEGHGISPARLQAAGYADERPVASNDTPEGRAANRRVELVVLADVGAALSDIANGAGHPVTLTIVSFASDTASTPAITMSNNVTLPDDMEVVYYANHGSVKFSNLKHFTGTVYASAIALDQQFTLTFKPVVEPGFDFDLTSSTHFQIQAGAFKEVPFS